MMATLSLHLYLWLATTLSLCPENVAAFSDAPSFVPTDECAGSVHSETCYTVTRNACSSGEDDGCSVFQGTYEYFTTSDDIRNIRTVLLTVKECFAAHCELKVIEYDGNTRNYPCFRSADTSSNVFVDGVAYPEMAHIFGEDIQSIAYREGEYFTLQEPENCDWVFTSDAPSLVPVSEAPSFSEGPTELATGLVSFGPSTWPSTAESFGPSSDTFESCYENYNLQRCYDPNTDTVEYCDNCYNVDITICTYDNGNGCIEKDHFYSYGPGNPNITIQTSVGCQDDPNDYYCIASIPGVGTCHQCLLEFGSGGLRQVATILDSCSEMLGGFLPPIDQTILLSEGDDYFAIADGMMVCASGVPSTFPSFTGIPSTFPSLVPSIIETQESTPPDFDDCFYVGAAAQGDQCYAVDVKVCTADLIDGGPECNYTEATYTYTNPRDDGSNINYGTLTIAASYGCDTGDYCSLENPGGGSCTCEILGDLIYLSNCDSVFEPRGGQLLRLALKGGGYPTIRSTEDMCEDAVLASSSLMPSGAAPSTVPSVTTSPSLVDGASGGFFSCYDSFAEGERENGNCYAVDVGICYEEFSGGSNDGCKNVYATYEYYNIQNGSKETYATISVSTTTCAGQGSCSISLDPNGACSACHVNGDRVQLYGCVVWPHPIQWNTHSFVLQEGGGYPEVKNTGEMCARPASRPSGAPFNAKEVGVPTEEGALVLRLKAHFTLSFFDGHEGDDPPDPSDILVLLARTKAFLWDILYDEYSALLKGIQVDKIQQTYQTTPEQEFELSFTAHITFDPDAIVKAKLVSELLSDNDSLRSYVGKYARYSAEGDPNGPFEYVKSVHSKIVGMGVQKQVSGTFV